HGPYRAIHAGAARRAGCARNIDRRDHRGSQRAATAYGLKEPLMSTVTSIEQLEAIYGLPAGASVWKEVDHITKEYRAFVEAAPFFALATNGPEGIDCSPRGDAPGFVRVADAKTLLIPDRRGNNRIDSL